MIRPVCLAPSEAKGSSGYAEMRRSQGSAMPKLQTKVDVKVDVKIDVAAIARWIVVLIGLLIAYLAR